ncbi:hypothetical protein AGMMS49942_21070 [Spirochaetia bacterium]|nr:hypothetical protein AGMMS49942_21070 [Spirochaetia bacterium]
MKAFLAILLLLSTFSCTTNTPEPQQGVILPQDPAFPAPVQITVPAPGPGTSADQIPFDPRSISSKEFEDARSEIALLIEEINRVIRANNYTKWLTYLSDDFIATINSPEYLDRISKTSRQLTMQRIVLKTPQDYFKQVVVAARQGISLDAHLDDIEFVSHTRVKAYTVKGNQRLRLFEFVKSRGTWKIALPN